MNSLGFGTGSVKEFYRSAQRGAREVDVPLCRNRVASCVRRLRRTSVGLALLLGALCWSPAARAEAQLSAENAGAVSPAAAAVHSYFSLPEPTGPESIGVRSGFVADASRIDTVTGFPRALPVRVWYPATCRPPRHAEQARYLSPIAQSFLEDFFATPAGTFNIATHAVENADPERNTRGVILVSPGFGNGVAFETALVTELASHGWTLVTFDHPHDTFIVEQPSGTPVPRDLDNRVEAQRKFAFDQRVLDVGVVLAHLPQLVPHWHRRIPVGMFGHSMGGAATAESMLRYPQLKAGVILDGSPQGDVIEQGLDQPLGLVHEPFPPEIFELVFGPLLSHLRGPHPVLSVPVAHNGFTDFVIFNPQAARVDPALKTRLEDVFDTAVPSVREGAAALRSQRRFLVDFMRRYLRQ